MRIIILFCIIAYASAQQYGCSPANYCNNQGYDRPNQMGCTYFCFMDQRGAGSLDCPDFHYVYILWKGSAFECDRNCFVRANREILPNACDVELNSAYDRIAGLDGNMATISGNDIESWCQKVKAYQPGGGRITPVAWQQWWLVGYSEIGNPGSC